MLTHSPAPAVGWTWADSARAYRPARDARYHAGTKSAMQVKMKSLLTREQIKEIWTSQVCWVTFPPVFHPLIPQDNMRRGVSAPELVWLQVACPPAWHWRCLLWEGRSHLAWAEVLWICCPASPVSWLVPRGRAAQPLLPPGMDRGHSLAWPFFGAGSSMYNPSLPGAVYAFCNYCLNSSNPCSLKYF